MKRETKKKVTWFVIGWVASNIMGALILASQISTEEKRERMIRRFGGKNVGGDTPAPEGY